MLVGYMRVSKATGPRAPTCNATPCWPPASTRAGDSPLDREAGDVMAGRRGGLTDPWGHPRSPLIGGSHAGTASRTIWGPR